MNIPFDAWWSTSLNSLGQQFLLGFPFPFDSAFLSNQIGNELLLRQNIIYITIRWVNMRGSNEPLFLVK